MMIAPFTQNEVSGNHIERDATPAAADRAAWSAVFADEPSPLRPIVNVGNFTTVHLAAARMLVLNGTHAFATEATLDFDAAGVAVPRLSATTVRGNVFRARGLAPAVSVESSGIIQFADNRCDLVGRSSPAVSLRSGAAVVSANVVSGGENSITMSATIDKVTVLGNITNGGILAGQTTLAGSPWERLNVRL